MLPSSFIANSQSLWSDKSCASVAHLLASCTGALLARARVPTRSIHCGRIVRVWKLIADKFQRVERCRISWLFVDLIAVGYVGEESEY